MSRGGRGGARGGKKNQPQIPGLDWSEVIRFDTKPTELFPAYKVPVAETPSDLEKRQVQYYISLRSQIHSGPLYTKTRTRDPTQPSKVYNEEQFNAQHNENSKANFDPFDGVPRFSHQYDQKKRAIPQLEGRSFAREFFPEELHATIMGEEGDGIRHAPGHSVKKKAGAFVNLNKAPNLTAAEKTKMLLEKLKDVTENEDGEGEVERDEDEENVDEEEADYDYEDDEAEMGGDYEAEQYFDGGEGDEDDGGEGGGGDDF